MLNQPTLEKMQAMKMSAMIEAFEQQLSSRSYAKLSFEERLGMLIDAEYTAREQRKLTRRLQQAKLRQPNACIEDVDFKTRRGLKRQLVMALARCDWIRDALNVVITGPTGTGKSYLACALANKACRSNHTAYYVRASQLPQDLAIARGDGSYPRLLKRLTRTRLLVIDDWLLTPFTDAERRDILEVIEDRHERASTLIASQLPISAWHQALGEPTLADSICDRLIHAAHKLELKGRSMRELRAAKLQTPNS
ncbi:MAG: IS21-like element helper ATPase IstB [Acidobacteriota bacterium]